MKPKTYSLVLVALACWVTANAKADDARLKQMFQTLTQRLRAAETERNNLISDKAQLEQEKKTLTAKMDTLTKQTAANKQELELLKTKTEAQEKELMDVKESLTKWKTAYEQVTTAAKQSDAERAKLAGESVILKRKLADRERKNLELFRLGNEILSRYEKFGLGDALAAKEPFTGIARVKLENLVQGYEDQLAEHRVKPEAK